MDKFEGKLAVVTGAGTGMGRELASQLVEAGCHVAFCDVVDANMEATLAHCREIAPDGVRVSAHRCDVSDEAQVIAFRDAVKREHDTDHINLLFNNAGVGGGGSFVAGERSEWDHTFGVCWFGVYHCTRAFMPMLVASDDGYLVNTSSVNGFWASLGPGIPHTAYSAAKFAVKGFSEALISDLRLNAPHVKVAVVMPGHIGTEIAINSRLLHGKSSYSEASSEELAAMRKGLALQGMPTDGVSDDQLRATMAKRMEDFRDKAPMSAAEAATVILDGVREDRWRILVGEDAKLLDQVVRGAPETAYELNFGAGPRMPK